MGVQAVETLSPNYDRNGRSDLIIDDFSTGDLRSRIGSSWRLVSDAVMGGVSHGELVPYVESGRPCLRLTGDVRLENNGGFVQASLDLANNELLDASAYAGFEIEVFGNGEKYNLHVRTSDTRLSWQSYRASFKATAGWQRVRLPFSELVPHRIDIPLNVRTLKRIGLVAIGRAFAAELCLASVILYRRS